MLYPDTQQTMTTGIYKVYLFSFVFQILLLPLHKFF